MPRRLAPIWQVLVLVGAIILIGYFVFPTTSEFPESGSQWRALDHSTVSLPAPVDDVLADEDILKALKLSSGFDFRRRCFNGITRTSLASVPQSLFEVPPSRGLSTDDSLPPCQDMVHLDVPDWSPKTIVDTSALFFGMATTLARIDASLPAISRWLSHSGSPLVVLLVDQADLDYERDTIIRVRGEAADSGIEMIFEPYKGESKNTEGLKNFALAEVLEAHRRPETQWFGIIDDDTFFIALPQMVKALKPYDPAKEWYIGALTEGLFRIAQEGFKAWGGAGFFVSAPLMEKLARNSNRCYKLDQGFGDLLWRDCILEVTSPTVKLTQLDGLNQIDVWGDISGWYESGWAPLLSVHHWKSWHFHPIPLAHSVADVAGPDTFLQRYQFDDSIVMTNGFSISAYPHGLPDLNRTELTFWEEVNRKGDKPNRLMFHHSLGATRGALQLGKDKIQWLFEYATYGADGSVRQFYINKAVRTGTGTRDSVIEIDWRQG
ncbi:hypothetical protein LTR78_002280 [Recurvomyces mirabilis]|uniref:Glycosyltransferase family 31 protein n=1 Tax=Recurvomyces mirabilis TaxID=574656 RepID=A0AAE1C4U1_9PEZI|nr:hypothetical protein LTR78_002280 [Recurvomyces mirabilis]KAK5160735.1 hypothetical protein LTS14_001748 [Recurvomyces mirabilis]